MARLAAGGAIVSDDGRWWWSGSEWKALSRQASTEPGPADGASAKVLAGRQKLSEADLRQRANGLAHKAPEREAARSARYEVMRSLWPLPVHIEDLPLPGGFTLTEDEFLIGTAKEWGLSAQNLALTTERLICPTDPSDVRQESVPLAVIRDITFRKHLLGFRTLAVETARGDRYLFPAHAGGQRVKDAILAMVAFAGGGPTRSGDAVAADKYDQLRKIGELKASGVLSEAEFEAEKAKLLHKLP
jgi:Short C-terminal domain